MIAVNKVDSTAIPLIRSIAYSTWPIAYGDILSAEQITYMLELFYSEPALQKQIEELQQQFILTTEENEPVGFASYSLKNKKENVYHLHKLYVDPGMQQKGIGSMLLNYILDDIRIKTAKCLELNVNRYNKTFRYYTKQGFHVIREEDIDIGNGFFMNDYIMRLDL